MPTITKNQVTTELPIVPTALFQKIIQQYLHYADRQTANRVFWYCKALLIIPCIIMVPALIAMAMLTAAYVWFIGLLIILFYANVLAHVAQCSGRIFVPTYHLTIAIMLLIPFITYLIL